MSRLRSLAGRPADGQRDALRATLLDAARLPVYTGAFESAGLTEAAIRGNPLASLKRLPLFSPGMYAPLAREALERRRHDLGGVELSSGSGGASKRRILSEEDIALDAARVTRLLEVAGLRADDRVAAIELSVTPLAVAFLEGCERLGVRCTVAVAWQPGAFPAAIERLAPSVLIAPPSLLERLDPAWDGLRLVIFNGDSLRGETVRRLHDRGIGVRSLYGLTETSALGVGCEAEAGVHLAPEHALFELRPLARDFELIVTTLGFSMPLLRYPTGDRIRLPAGPCPCGLDWPRVEIAGRLSGRFSLFEIETSVDELRALLLDPEDDAPFQIVIADAPDGRVRMTLRLPAPTRRGHRQAARARLATHPLIDHLLATRLLEVRFEALEPVRGRKLIPLVDRRSGGSGDGR